MYKESRKKNKNFPFSAEETVEWKNSNEIQNIYVSDHVGSEFYENSICRFWLNAHRNFIPLQNENEQKTQENKCFKLKQVNETNFAEYSFKIELKCMRANKQTKNEIFKNLVQSKLS